MKILKHKNIMGIIYGILLLMPFLSILARSAYVVVNKNAYQSYSEVVETTTTQLTDGDSFNDGMLYTFAWNGQMTGATNNKIDVLDGKTNIVDLFFTGETWKVDYFNPSYETTRTRLIVYDTNGSQHNAFMWQDVSNTFYAYTKSTSATLQSNSLFSVYSNTYTTSKLDNVFEYSVSQFIEDNNFGKVNLFNWFTDLFLDDNAHNNMYVHYINWYLNYSMLVSCMHLLFLVLMWFVNYSKRLLDRGMNYDW